MPIPRRPDLQARDMFETRTHAWREAGLEREIERKEASRARWQVVVFLLLFVGVVVAYTHRHTLFPGAGETVRWGTVLLLLIFGWVFARSVGRLFGPSLFRRLDPGTAGTVGFLMRLVTIGVAMLVALRIAGIETRALAIGGAVTAVVFGLAAQQTLGNLIAGMVLLSARPFRVGDRVRLQGGPIGGDLEGIVSSLGLVHTALVSGADRILVPNTVMMSIAIIPVREPSAVNVRARFPLDVRPSAVQELLEGGIEVPTRRRPDVEVQEMDGDEMVVRITATPQHAADGAKLADQMLAAIADASSEAGANGGGPPEPGDLT
jgi:small-conductance mechanosensitive channel